MPPTADSASPAVGVPSGRPVTSPVFAKVDALRLTRPTTIRT
jgi:hypothetical protein